MKTIAWLNTTYKTLHHADAIKACADVRELEPLVLQADAEKILAALFVTRGNIESLAAAQSCTIYAEWARVIDEALVDVLVRPSVPQITADDADAMNEDGYARMG